MNQDEMLLALETVINNTPGERSKLKLLAIIAILSDHIEQAVELLSNLPFEEFKQQ
jgi:hypothetical protein